jgi:hypothetical protein
MRAAVCIACSVLALAGCSKPAAEHAPPAASAPVLQFQRPHPRLGLWSMTVSTDRVPGFALAGEICIDASTERSAFEPASRSRSRNCSEPRFSPNPGGGVSIDGACEVNGRSIVSHAVATGDFSTRYTLDVTTRMDPPLPGGLGEHTRMQARWIGPCAEGQRPGQMTRLRPTALGQG